MARPLYNPSISLLFFSLSLAAAIWPSPRLDSQAIVSDDKILFSFFLSFFAFLFSRRRRLLVLVQKVPRASTAPRRRDETRSPSLSLYIISVKDTTSLLTVCPRLTATEMLSHLLPPLGSMSPVTSAFFFFTKLCRFILL